MLTTADSTRCGIRFHPRDIRGLDEPWQCPHECAKGQPVCLYHLPPESVDPDQLADQFVADVRSTGASRRRKQFVGATFPELRHRNLVLDSDDTYPIDLRGATVAGDVDLSGTAVRQPVEATGMTVEGDLVCEDATFEGYLNYNWLTVAGKMKCKWARFESHVGLADATVGPTSFKEATFDESVAMERLTVDGEFDCGATRFRGKLHAHDATFDGRTSFTGGTFEQFVSLHGATFGGDLWFNNSDAAAEVVLRGVAFDDPAPSRGRFQGSSFAKLTLKPADSGEHGTVIDLENATVVAGSLMVPFEGVTYSLKRASLGDVSLDPEAFGAYDVRETTFDGFDFADDANRRALVDNHWRVRSHALGDVRPAALESTYLKLKNGADQSGANRVAGEFLRREFIARRDRYRQEVRSGSLRRKLECAGAWIANAGMGLTCGHGERPSRVIAISVAVVVVFAGFFAAVWQGTPPYGSTAGFLVLSIESFVTLVLGGAEKVGKPWWLRLLAEIEGFLGVFLVALFVFALTRSVDR